MSNRTAIQVLKKELNRHTADAEELAVAINDAHEELIRATIAFDQAKEYSGKNRAIIRDLQRAIDSLA